jgi:glycosyltransferase 2 family protein
MKWKKIIGISIGAIVLLFLLNILYSNWNTLLLYDWHINLFWIIPAYLLLTVSPFLLALSTKILLKHFDKHVKLLKIFNILNISIVLRYIPGNIWTIASRAELFKEHEISRITSTVIFFTELGISILAVGAISILSILIGLDAINNYIYGIVFIMAFTLFLLHPFVLQKGIQFIFRIFKKETIKIYWKYKTILLLFIIQVIHWTAQGVAFYFITRSIYPISPNLIIPLIGIYVAAWLISFLAFISPGGLGIKEGILVLLLQNFMPIDIATVISIASRIITLIHEVTLAGVSILLRRLEQ